MSEKSSDAKVLAMIDEKKILDMEQACIRIPSSAFKEHEIADYLANVMVDIGLEVEMMDVGHPIDPEIKSRQPIGKLKGSGDGPTLMLNGHMDPGVEMSGWSVDPYGAKYEDGWIWGMGAHDDKGGLVAMIHAVDAIIRSGTHLKGDILVCPVVAHKLGGAGTRALLGKGLHADMCINMEHSANTIAKVLVGIVMIRVRTHSPDLFFRYSDEARANYFNPIEQQCEIIRRVGPSLDQIPAAPKGWLTYEPHSELPGFPTHTFDTIHKEHYYHPNLSGMSSRECELVFQVRTVPGQTIDSIEADFVRLLEGIKQEHPAFSYELTVPAGQHVKNWQQDPVDLPRDHPLVEAVAAGQKIASGKEAFIGARGRIGNVGDGNILQAAGIPSVQYGPGDIRIYKEWPTPDERVLLSDLVIASKAVAIAAARLCG
jgi:acetylornithine deacetylase/succinyl-diaminopimelate desuccinylase-like protein